MTNHIPRTTRRQVLATTAVGASTVAGCTGSESSETPVDAPATLIATWRGGDPARTTTLQWVTESDGEPASRSVSLSEERSVQTDVSRFGIPNAYPVMYHHRATFDDLDPDTVYGVTIDGDDTGLEVQTAPETLTESLVFAQGGDIGTSRDVPDLHQQAASWDPLFALVGGDLAYGNATSQLEWVEFLEDWHAHMRSDRRLIPIAAGIGNHEVQGGMHGTPEDAPFYYQLFDNRQRERAYWALDIGESVSFLILDSNHSTPVPGTQTEWLESALAERSDREHVAAVTHVPAYPSSKPITGAGRDRVDVREHWVPLFEEYDVDIVFEHDDHTYKRTHLLDGGEQSDDGILYVGDGAWGKGPRVAKTPEERPYLATSESSLNVIRTMFGVDGSRQYRAVDAEGETLDHFDGAGERLSEE